MPAPLDGAALATALTSHRLAIVPRVGAELRRWVAAAERIPDEALRAAARASLREKGGNAEATAVFAILAPRGRRAEVVRAIVSLQVAIDYLDTLGEEPGEDPLATGLALHGALADALSGGGDSDWYRLSPSRDDGGYLASLVQACREEVAALPSIEAVRPDAVRAARRCAEGQSHTHAAALGSCDAMRDWAQGLGAPPGYEWWEAAAGASSSVAAHALIAAAADPRTDAAEAGRVDAAYFPSIGALTVLLDDLIDREADAAAGEHNYIAYYGDGEVAARRLGLLADRAKAAVAGLRHRSRHAAILAGVAGYYLSAPGARGGFASPARRRLLESLGGPARLVIASRRLSHRD